MIRRIIEINEEKCNGCGICANACHEGAIEIVNGKAKLLREDYCDGLGDCLPACPMNAISFVEREAPEYNEAAVKAAQAKKAAPASFVCPGMRAKALKPANTENVFHLMLHFLTVLNYSLPLTVLLMHTLISIRILLKIM